MTGDLLPSRADNPRLELLRRRNALWLAAFVVLVFTALVGRLAVIQIRGHESGLYKVRRQERRPAWRDGSSLAERPERAGIRDRRGRVLARSWFEHMLVVDPTLVAQGAARGADVEIVRFLPAILSDAGVPFDEEELLERVLTTRRIDEKGRSRRIRHRVLVHDLSPEQRRRVQQGIDAAGLIGLHFAPRPRRTYPHGADAAQVVGVIGESASGESGRICGRAGVELWCDRLLAGGMGTIDAAQDALGREFVLERTCREPVVPGVEVALTIDVEIQRICHQALAAHAAEHAPRSASAVVLSVESGEILGAATWPRVDPEAEDADFDHLRLSALQDAYDPGSSIKPLFVAWALDRNAITRETRVDCGGVQAQESFGPRTVREYSVNPEPLDAEGVLVRSSNVGSVRIALQHLGLRGMYDALEAFGMAHPGTLAFPACAEPTYTPWSRYVPRLADLEGIGRLVDGRTPHRAVAWTGISFAQGYEMRFSPLQMARLYLAFARVGTLVEPTLVRELRGPGWVRRPRLRERRVLGSGAATAVREAMLQVVENPRGTGHKARSDRWTIAAKSGTAEIQGKDAEGRPLPRRTFYNAWFCAIAPAHRPEVVVVVVNHGVRHRGPGTYSGGSVSGPVARDVVEATLDYLGLAPDRPEPAEVAR